MKKFVLFCMCCLFAVVANAQYYHRHHYAPRTSCGGAYVVTRTVVHRPVERVVVREEPRYSARTTTNITNNYYYATEQPRRAVEVRKPSNTCHKPYAEYDFEDECTSTPSKVVTSAVEGINPHDVKYTIWFKLNSHKLKQKSDVINCQNAAEILERYPNLKLVVYGYASQRSGTTAYNDVLAQRRIDEVTNYLINGCHVDWSRIKFVNKGSREAAYSNDEWNQNVILKFE